MPTTASIDAKVKAAPAAELCSTELQWDPWAYDVTPERSRPPAYGAGASQWDTIPPSAPVQGEIPERYRSMSGEEIAHRLAAAKARLGSRLVILGHHYQRDEIIRYADLRGDSLQALPASGQPPEDATTSSSAACISWPRAPTSSPADHQRVILPNLAAGCSMADMADEAQVLPAGSSWERRWASTPLAPTRAASAAPNRFPIGERRSSRSRT